MIYQLGPRARRIYSELRTSIVNGERVSGDKLPSHLHLASQYGVAPMTIRHALAHLETEGLVTREHGRGTFVCEQRPAGVLIVDDDPVSRMLLCEQVRQLGLRPVSASGPSDGVAVIQREAHIVLVLSDVRMPSAKDGIGFIRTVRRRWPEIPLAAVTGYAEDLADLLGTTDCPLLILSKPVRSDHLQQALQLAMGRRDQRAAA